MKKLVTLLICLPMLAFTACSESDQTPSWFATAPQTQVDGTSVDVSCRTLFSDGVVTAQNAGFAYAPVGDAVGELTEVRELTIEGSTISCSLVGLDPTTSYIIFAFVDASGQQFQSKAARFETGEGHDPGNPDLSFSTPTSTGVTTSAATVNCTFSYVGEGAISEAYFSYATATGTPQRAAVTTAAGAKSASLSGLSALTEYTFWLCVVIDGETFTSATAHFSTAVDPSKPTGARYLGWAELPVEASKPGEYFHAYHLCPDVYVSGSGSAKRRNFSVCYSNELKSAVWVAAPMHTCYVGGSGRNEVYRSDPSISTSQPGKWKGYTRGHMLGSGERTISQKTNEQVFYYSNIAPQLGQPYFNTGGGAWNTIEDWVDTQWKNNSDTTYQVIGGYWKNKNKKVSGTTIPTHYYKVLLRTKGHKNKWVATCSRDELQCIAIMVEHRTYKKEEVAKPSQYEAKGMLYTVKEMEELTGVTFFANVPNAPKDSYNVSDWGL